MITTKDNICEIAMKLFQQHGYEQVSISFICQQLNVTRGSFYHHFSSKNALLLYWFSQQIEKDISIDYQLSSPRQIVKEHALAFANIIDRIGYDFIYHILMAEFEIEGQHFNSYFQAEDDILRLIELAMEKGEIHSNSNAKSLLDTFAAAIIGTVVLWKFELGKFDIVQRIENIFDTVYSVGDV